MEKGCLAWNKEKASILVIFGTSKMILQKKMLQRPFPKLKKHGPTNLYMLYRMVQSVWLVCVEKVKKMTLQRQCPLSSPKSFWCAASTPQRAKQKPYLQGTGAPRHYPHTLISIVDLWSLVFTLCSFGRPSTFDTFSEFNFEILKNALLLCENVDTGGHIRSPAFVRVYNRVP